MTMTTPHLAVVTPPVEAAIESVLEPLTTRAPSRSWPTGVVTRLLPDLAAAAAGVAAAHGLATGSHPAVLLALPFAWLVLVAACGGYVEVPGTTGALQARAVLRAGAGLGVLAWITAAFTPGVLVEGPAADLAAGSRTVLLVVGVLALLSLGFRFLASRSASRPPVRVVVAGDPVGVSDVLDELRRPGRRHSVGFEAIGVCVPPGRDVVGHDLRQWIGLDLLLDAVVDSGAAAVIMVPGPHADHRELRRLGARLQDCGVGLLIGSGLRDVAPARLGLGAAGGLGLLHVRPAPLHGPRRRIKNAVDRSLAAGLLVATAPLLLTVAALIRRDSPGSALFRQERVGRDGRLFTMLKFRTMSTDASRLVDTLSGDNESDRAGVLFKIRQDPRITRVGAVLRRYSLDELPQLCNVVRGEMSLVGPRPALPAEVAAYCPDMRRRLVVRPGLTGLWQVSGRSDLAWEETVRLDLQYVDNWSLSLDLAIALRTAGAVLGHRGAY